MHKSILIKYIFSFSFQLPTVNYFSQHIDFCKGLLLKFTECSANLDKNLT